MWDAVRHQNAAMARDNTTAHDAAEYDRKVRQVIPFYETLHQQTRELVASIVPAPECWLDTGCGTGTLVAGALASFPRTRFVLADPSEAMLAEARARLGHEARVTVLPAAPTGALPDVTPAPQVITALMCHHYLSAADREVALGRCRALLRDGGVLVTFENVAATSPDGTRIGLARWGEWQRRQGRAAPEVEEHLARFGRELQPITVAEHMAALRDAGFRVVELLWASYMQAGFWALR